MEKVSRHFRQCLVLWTCMLLTSECHGYNLEDVLEEIDSRSDYQLRGNGPTFTRWGRSECPPVSEKVYNGYMSGPKHNFGGSGSNYLCLPTNPQWGDYSAAFDNKRAVIVGVEMKTSSGKPYPSYLQDHDSACVVCQTINSNSILMVPARLTCPLGWTSQYNGYLMSEMITPNRRRTEYICYDGSPVQIQGSGDRENQAMITPVEVQCGSLDCSKYVSGRELTCVVCSR
ncbi:short-chain collagen C4-like [Mytilus trossulus]|uniref:short-chain collagen C4-like n=1 Tax=Mytilus trossulus TaxID=6551 RepID=UPI003004ADC7